ncbi:hypothetical protein [Streptomyces sp. NPDC002994]|uniref:hypothetical protein n=1 Tax=Streptomyces sp. NPDC002994 TaxID=3154441 RepID=UPI0033BC2CCE
MPGDKYAKYGVAVPPADPNADVMTVQESAFVLKCSVSHLRRVLKDNPKLRSRSGRRVVMNRAARDAYYRMHQGDKHLAKAA